jgi:hypothetical protein
MAKLVSNLQFKCNGEIAEVSTDGGQTWDFVVDCCESLGYTLERIISAANIDCEIIHE